MEPDSVAPTYKASDGYRTVGHIRDTKYISSRGTNGISHEPWSPSGDLPGQEYIDKVNSDYSDAKIVHWPSGQNPPVVAKEKLGDRKLKHIAPHTTINTLVKKAA